MAPARLTAASALLLVAQCRGGEPRVQTPTDVSIPDAAPSPLDPPMLHVVLDEPRFADARAKERARAWADAADAVRAAAPPDEQGRCAAAYVEGRLRALAQDSPGAADAFDRAAAAACPLRAYASLRAAQAWGRQGKADEAILRARAALAAVDPIAFGDDASLVLAEALAAKGERAEALALWRASLKAHPRGARWVDTSVRLATALLDGADGEPAARAKEALDAATRVVVEAPQLADASGAAAARARALALLPAAPRSLDAGELARRAQAWLDAGKLADARKDADAALTLVPKTEPSERCKIQTIRAQLAAKARAAPADAWGDAIASCAAADARGDALAHALFAGAKASWSAKRTDEALARFARVEKELPAHRYADDARLLGALVHEERGELSAFAGMLASLPDDYPKGDMRTEALFRLALHHLAAGDLGAASPVLARAAPMDAGNRHWATAGRVAYFAARVRQKTGDVEGAKSGFSQLVRDHAMQFYMFQAYGRLAAADAAFAKKTLDEAMRAEPSGPMLTHEHEATKKPAFARALRLLEVGELDAAKKELATAGAVGDGAEPELEYVVADLMNRAGAFDWSVGVSRAKVTEHLAHAPAGRWRYAWEASFPKAFEPAVRKAAADRGLPASLVWGIMREESGFVAEAKSPSGALGLMQLMPQTAKELARGTTLPFDEEALKQPDVSIDFGTRLLANLRATYAATRPLAIAAYNAGGGAVSRWTTGAPADFDLWVELIPYEETRGYVKRVLASQGTYATLYDAGEQGEVLGLPEKVVAK